MRSCSAAAVAAACICSRVAVGQAKRRLSWIEGVEEECLLRDDGEEIGERGEGKISDVVPVDRDGAGIGLVETCDKIGQGGFARAAGADECDVRRGACGDDAVIAAREQGISSKSKRAEFRKIVSQAEGEVNAEIQAALGDPAYAAYQQYQQTVSQHNLLSQLEKAGASGSPLSEEQKSGIRQVFNQVKSDKAVDGPGTNALLSGGGTAKVSDETVTLAKNVLSAPQLLALQQIQKDQQWQKLVKGKSSPSAGR